MQSKGFISFLSASLSLICLYYLSFTYYAYKIEKEASLYAKGDFAKEREYLSSASKKTINFLFIKYNYLDAKEKSINLGLDLKGGINVILQVSEKELLVKLSDQSKVPSFLNALNQADIQQKKTGNADYLNLFFNAFKEENKKSPKPQISLADIFSTKELSDSINRTASDKEVQKALRSKIEVSLNAAYDVIRSRVDRFGVTQPNVQRIQGSDRILVELPGVKEIERVKKLLQRTAQLGFWEVYSPREFFPYLQLLDKASASLITTSEEEKIPESNSAKGDLKTPETTRKKTLLSLLNFSPNKTNALGRVHAKDKDLVDSIFKNPQILDALPSSMRGVKFSWSAKPIEGSKNHWELFTLRPSLDQKGAALNGEFVTHAERSSGQFGEILVGMQMSLEGAYKWKAVTEKNQGRSIAIVLDDFVYTAPVVNSVIPNGRSQISGNFSLQEAEDLVNVLNSGKLSAPTRIVQAEVVGPSLGKEAIENGISSSIIALVVVFAWMIFYYMGAGVYANLALIFNLLFIFGILISLGAVLTLPGIAGIVLTLAMAVDANVLLYERVKEEIHKGKSLRVAINDGYSLKGALSSIVDGQVTTLLTGVILFIFGKGPIQGFATTLIIGIFTSIFSAVCLSRLFIEWHLSSKKTLSFFNKLTEYFLKNINWDFLSKRKYAYVISTLLMIISLSSFFVKGFNLGVDFLGGRTYIVRFDHVVKPENIASDLKDVFVENAAASLPEVKTFGEKNQKVKITTKYKASEDSLKVDDEIVEKLFFGLKNHLPKNLTLEEFRNIQNKDAVGILSSIKVGPTVAKDITQGAFFAVVFSLLGIFIYILFRFKKWQLSLGAVLALFHDVIIVLGIFSLLYGVLPFPLEIDQAFIAAILTVIGYSINDSVIVYDRIREYLSSSPDMPFRSVINKAISSTLSRTINTSLITLFVIFIIFLFGGETIRGFMFALLIGIGFGTYSSVFIAASLTYDFVEKSKKKETAKEIKLTY